MTREEYTSLYEKYISGKCTLEECRLVENYQDSFELSEQAWDRETMGDPELIRENISAGLNETIERRRRGRITNFPKWIAAASIMLAVSSALLYFNVETASIPDIVLKDQPLINDIAPGNSQAILTLDDGSVINLDDAKNGLIATENSTIIKKLPDGRLQYVAGTAGADYIRYNSISTPRGGEFQITLSDGSQIWLNAGSSIRFPTVFTGIERTVEITGEAYFEIAKNALMPFKVLANNSEIKVLGTHFNVMAYDNENNMSTTLVEGSVQITKGFEKFTIRPGQAAVLNKSTGNIKVATADIEQAIAWKNGYFIFADENIESIMRKLSRWYNVDVSYKGNLDDKDFTGTISRAKKVSEVLKMLELTGAIHFKIIAGDASGKGRRITVMP